jgi:hypothetical protein
MSPWGASSTAAGAAKAEDVMAVLNELLAVTDPLVGSLAWYEQVEARSDRHAELLYELIRKPVLISVVNGS